MARREETRRELGCASILGANYNYLACFTFYFSLVVAHLPWILALLLLCSALLSSAQLSSLFFSPLLSSSSSSSNIVMDYPPQTQGLTPHPADLNPPSALNSYQQPLHSQSQRHLSGSPYSQRSRRPLSYQPQPTYLDAGGRSNTSSPHRRQSPVPGRFTEEWDASQRGSSILDNRRGRDSPVMSSSGAGPAAIGTAAMQRSSSVNSYAAGDDRGLPQRGNTLKKKASLRRSGTGSLVRSSSRRSARAGSVKSLMLQTADANELQSAFYCPVPTTGNPTDVLAGRFQSMLLSLLFPPRIPCIGPWRNTICYDVKQRVSSDANVMRQQQPGGKS